MVQWFPMTDIWALKIWTATNCGSFFEKINFQGRGKLIFHNMSPNKFSEVSHTNGCKTALGTVC